MIKQKMFIISSLVMITGFIPINGQIPLKPEKVSESSKERATCTRPLTDKKISGLKDCLKNQIKRSRDKVKESRRRARNFIKKGFYPNFSHPYDNYHHNERRYYHSDRSTYVIHDVSPTGNTVELNNGAVFTISSSDIDRVRSWKHAKVHITPNNRWPSWYSSCEYLLVNNLTQVTAEATLTLGPLKHSPHTRRIMQIDRDRGIVSLDDGTVWQVNNTERERMLLREWVAQDQNPYNPQEGDFIIVGENNNTWQSNKNILINIATNSYLTFSSLN